MKRAGGGLLSVHRTQRGRDTACERACGQTAAHGAGVAAVCVCAHLQAGCYHPVHCVAAAAAAADDLDARVCHAVGEGGHTQGLRLAGHRGSPGRRQPARSSRPVGCAAARHMQLLVDARLRRHGVRGGHEKGMPFWQNSAQ